MRYVLEALARHHSVDALVIRHGEQAYVERQGTARILRVPLHDDDLPARIEAFRRALRRQLEGAEYDVVHFRDGWSGMLILELRKHFGYRTVFDLSRAPSAEAPVMDLDLGNQLMRAEQHCLVGADFILTPTEIAHAHILETRTQGVFLVPPGVNVDLFDWDVRPPGRPVILYAGSVEPGHGIRVLLRAMVYVVAEFDAQLVIAGAIDDGFRRMLDTAIDDLGLVGRVELPGEVEHKDMPQLIARATICVAPAACESQSQPLSLYPTKLLEYMACRRVTVAPRRGTTLMVMRNATHGMMFTPGDPVDLARNLGVLLREPDLAEHLAAAGYRHVREFHTASGVRRALRHVYQEIVGDVVEPRERTGDYPTAEESTDRTHALPDDMHAPDEITETNQVGSFQQQKFPGVAQPDARPAAETFDSRVPTQMAAHDTWGHQTDETVLTTEPQEPPQRDSEEWIVPEWDERRSWKSLADFQRADGDERDPFIDSGETPFVAGEISVDPSRVDSDPTPPFTAVSVLLGSLSDDNSGRGK